MLCGKLEGNINIIISRGHPVLGTQVLSMLSTVHPNLEDGAVAILNTQQFDLTAWEMVAKALKTVLHCKAPLIAAQCNKTTHSVSLLHKRSLKIYSR